jgi:hypothetical protein
LSSGRKARASTAIAWSRSASDNGTRTESNHSFSSDCGAGKFGWASIATIAPAAIPQFISEAST